MDIVQSPLKFNNYCADKIIFEVNYGYVKKEGAIVELSPIITKEISEPEGNSFFTTLNLKIENEEDPDSLPFKLEISITGWFEVEVDDPECKDDLMKNNSIVILLPFLRSLVTTVTAGANIPPLVLPVLDLNGLFEEDEE